jgi:uncharacterized SAM-binding protein YcdF (DUF218 family)
LVDPIWVKAVIKAIVLPPCGPLLVSLTGLAILRRRPRAGRLLAALGVLTLLALSLPVVAWMLVRALYDGPVFEAADARTAQAIVILGGGIRRAPELGGDTMNRLTLERIRFGARVARLTRLPVLVSGGSTYGNSKEAWLMRDALRDEFGVEVRWVEDASRTTAENATRTAGILRAQGITRVVLVTHSFDVPRARAEFATRGIETVTAATNMPASRVDSITDFLPSMSALQESYYALYELLANAVRRASGPAS